jgi:hypothetical protein
VPAALDGRGVARRLAQQPFRQAFLRGGSGILDGGEEQEHGQGGGERAAEGAATHRELVAG